MKNDSINQQHHHQHHHHQWRILFCVVIFALSVGLGISIGYTQRTPDFNPISALKPFNTSRIINLGTDLVAVDAIAGTMILDWSIEDDTACDFSRTPPCPSLNPNSTVDIFFDANILRQDSSTNSNREVPSDNPPDTPIFRHNATAVYDQDVRNALSAFRTTLALFSTQRGKSSLSTLQRYPFDEYTAQIFVFALDSATNESVGLRIGRAEGIAGGYKAVATLTPLRDYPGVISELITISRSTLVKAYAVIIVAGVWLMTIMFMFVTASIVCGYGLDAGLLLVPVATLYAVTQLRASMPGAPAGFGAVIDFIGLLPCLALTSFAAFFTIGALVFASPTKHSKPIWAKTCPICDEKSDSSC